MDHYPSGRLLHFSLVAIQNEINKLGGHLVGWHLCHAFLGFLMATVCIDPLLLNGTYASMVNSHFDLGIMRLFHIGNQLYLSAFSMASRC